MKNLQYLLEGFIGIEVAIIADNNNGIYFALIQLRICAKNSMDACMMDAFHACMPCAGKLSLV